MPVGSLMTHRVRPVGVVDRLLGLGFGKKVVVGVFCLLFGLVVGYMVNSAARLWIALSVPRDSSAFSLLSDQTFK